MEIVGKLFRVRLYCSCERTCGQTTNTPASDQQTTNPRRDLCIEYHATITLNGPTRHASAIFVGSSGLANNHLFFGNPKAIHLSTHKVRYDHSNGIKFSRKPHQAQ